MLTLVVDSVTIRAHVGAGERLPVHAAIPTFAKETQPKASNVFGLPPLTYPTEKGTSSSSSVNLLFDNYDCALLILFRSWVSRAGRRHDQLHSHLDLSS